ncbi:Ubiquitin-conjugating enzyme E2 1 [Polyrhizophydium stewartii]|uniref:Ubiquitin-conjugating enzyme E2 1 n=1 Tax=Polyrhizophydium stewartii TaxID=2732419 RepID=A0ABR4N9J1_9FUNG
MVDIKRIERELRAANSDSDTSVVVRPVEDNLCHLKGVFIGPADTVYEGGEFVVDIQIPDEYPFRPPKVRGNAACFWIPPGADPVQARLSRQQDCAICLDILKDAWTPVLTLKTALISLQSLLCEPQPKDPQDAQVAKHYLSDRKGFDDTARYWTQTYAAPSNMNAAKASDEIGINQQAVQRLVEMGFDRPGVVRALRKTDGDENRAIELILSGGAA